MKSGLKTLLGTAALAVMASAGMGAAPAAAAICPSFGADTDCGIIITLNPGWGTANPSFYTIVGTGQPPYDFSEDTLLGVINNSGQLVTKFHLISSNLSVFSFDGDGITSTVYPPPNGAPGNSDDPTGYGGPITFFSNIGIGCLPATTCADVEFQGGTSPGLPTGLGGSNGSPNVTYFSLEENIDPGDIIIVPIEPPTGVPEPMTLALFGAGLAGLGALRRRKAKKA